MMHFLAALLLTLAPGNPAAQDTDSPEPSGFFAEGSRIVWIGDSITHACLFTRYLEDYAWTRYPERNLRFENAGVSGDRVLHALSRFDDDIAIWKPNRVLVCFGMNDAGFASFAPDRLQTYERHLRLLLDRCAKIGAEQVLMGVPPTDDVARRARHSGLVFPPIPGDYESTLRRFADATKRIAEADSLPYVDLFGPLRRHRQRLRLLNPGATLSPDGIHPSPATSALIAMTILRQLGERGARLRVDVGSTGIQLEGGELVLEPNEKVDGESRKLRIRAHRLPWPLPLEAREAVLLDDSFASLNSTWIRHSGLEPGTWQLVVDGTPLYSTTATDWGLGVELGLLTQHPDWTQAVSLSERNGRRNARIRTGIRELWEARRIAAEAGRPGAEITPSTRADAERRVRALHGQLEDTGRAVLELLREIESLRKPRPHSYEWRRVSG